MACGSAAVFLTNAFNRDSLPFYGSDAIVRGLIYTAIFKNPSFQPFKLLWI
jgi:hypothetical protein